MVVIGRGISVDEGKIQFFSSSSIELALETVAKNLTKFTMELYVDFSEIKNYKDKYEEIYSKLFKEYTGEERENNKNSDYSDVICHVKSINEDSEIFFDTFSTYEDAIEFIDEFNHASNNGESASAQVLVNLSEIQDYKEKYDEFYSLMLDSYKKNRTTKEKDAL